METPSVSDLPLFTVFISLVFFYIWSIQNADDIIETHIVFIVYIAATVFPLEKWLQ